MVKLCQADQYIGGKISKTSFVSVVLGLLHPKIFCYLLLGQIVVFPQISQPWIVVVQSQHLVYNQMVLTYYHSGGMIILNHNHLVINKKGVISMKKTLAWILCAIMAILLFTACAENANTVVWEELSMGSILPKPESLKGKSHEFSDTLYVDLDDVTKEAFDAYKQSCIDAGFNVDVIEQTGTFYMYNTDGYKLTLRYTAYSNQMSIVLDAPMQMGEFGWPNTDPASNIPLPPGNRGKTGVNTEKDFLVYMADMDKEAYAAYVAACMEYGYTVDYRKEDIHFQAENEDGYTLVVNYEGYNIVSIRVTAPKTEETMTTEPASTEPAPTEKADTGALRSDFKAAMDSYEAFMDEYIEFIEKYEENPTDIALITSYTSYMTKYTQFVEDFAKWEDEEMNAAEEAYYFAVQARVSKKLMEVGLG